MGKMDKKILMYLLVAVSSVMGYEREKNYIMVAKNDFSDPDFLEDEIEVVEKAFRKYEKAEAQGSVVHRPRTENTDKKEWAARRLHILKKLQEYGLGARDDDDEDEF